MAPRQSPERPAATVGDHDESAGTGGPSSSSHADTVGSPSPTTGPVSRQSTDFGFIDAAPTAEADPLIGADLGGIRIERMIGEGGMGRVYEARQEHPARIVAVKVMRMPALSAAAVRRFRREADALGRLRHPGIAQIYSAGCLRLGTVDVPFYVMEFIPGGRTLVRACHRMAPRPRLELLREVCEAVGHGHAAGIVHRDLKPGNVLVGPEGRPKVIDFGIARFEDDGTGDGPRTDTGQFLGTLPYMAPEQFLEERTAIDARTDVYALGVLMHQVLAGRLPYDVAEKSLVETAKVVQHARPIPLPIEAFDRHDPRLVSGADAIASKCLAKNPANRYATARDMAEDLRRLLVGEPLIAGPRPQDQRLGKKLLPMRRVAALGFASCMVVGLLFWLRDGRGRGDARRAVASPAGPSFPSGARPGVGCSFPHVSNGRTSPLGYVHLTFDEDVFALSPADFQLSHDGRAIGTSGLSVSEGPRSWRIGGLAAVTAAEGDYELTFVGTQASPVDAGGTVRSGFARVRWRSPAYREIRFSVLDEDWSRYVVATDGLERYTERKAGDTTFIRPTDPGREGVMTMRFDVPFAIQDAAIVAPLSVWTTGDPFPYDPGARAGLDVSPDGQAWTEVCVLQAGSGGSSAGPHDIAGIVAGSRQVWVRVRLTGTREWPGDGLIFAQFLRADPTRHRDVSAFVLTATGPHPPVIPQPDARSTAND